jgi:integrase
MSTVSHQNPAISPHTESSVANADSVARYLGHLMDQGMSPHTIYDRRRVLSRLAAALPVPLLEASPDELAAWRVTLRRLSAGSAANYLGHVRCYYRWAADEGLIEASPAARLPVPRRPRRLPRPIGEDGLALALASAPGRLRIWLVLAAFAGLRACEIAGLRGENVLLRAAQPYVLVAEDATKGIRERAVPLCPFAVAELAAAGLPSRGWAFARLDGAPGPNHPARVSQVCNRFLHDHGIPETLHQLRHRFGTQAYAASHDLRAVQELMGHANPATTGCYVLVSRPSAVAAVRALPVPGGHDPQLAEPLDAA